ncbi:indolepyruvate ferredoxin oxidoreductase subunit alpha [Streptacidiphilus griseoplanus]|uniref:indolepyruvate ferredoxin oxidoreductase subunit alpha n=1 Tax=Peterkaempfera griseoplana TaxID=66896 RepID=UPI0006E21E32|nr:4Fe-4S dicluster binding protein [Peterkaempfera griseoplana]
MTYVISDQCTGVKDASCVSVCPVDCIQPVPGSPDFGTAEQLYINPSECIDCTSCAFVCPVDACYPEDELPAQWASAAARNAEYFR